MLLALFLIPQPCAQFVLSWCFHGGLCFPLTDNTYQACQTHGGQAECLILGSVSPETSSKAGSVLLIILFPAPEQSLHQSIST